MDCSKDIPDGIPHSLHQRYADILEMITEFCAKHLDDDYKRLCLQALKRLCLEEDELIETGKASMWAAGIVCAIAQNTNVVRHKKYFSFDEKPKYRLSSMEISDAFGVSNSGMMSKAKLIKECLGIDKENEEWMTSEWLDSKGRKWFLALDEMMDKYTGE